MGKTAPLWPVIGHSVGLTATSLAGVVGILILDWLTPAGIVVGILLCIPIMLSSLTDDRRSVWLTFGIAFVGFFIAAAFGRGPISPEAVWIPNRIFVSLTLPAACAIALRIQTRRIQISRAREEATRSSQLNRLLMSLLAHDLRSPLSMAVETFEYVDGELARGERPDSSLLTPVVARLTRSLGKLDSILGLAKTDMEISPAQVPPRSGHELATDLTAELRGFLTEAQLRRKDLRVDVSGDDESYCDDMLVVRQACAILIDNAIRYAKPGPVLIEGTITHGTAHLRVSDAGPAGGTSQPGSSGLGLELCRALVLRAGGWLEQSRGANGGTVFSMKIPVRTSRAASDV